MCIVIDTKTLVATRQALGLTQQRLAELAGLSLPTIYKIEAGQQAVQISTLEAIATAMDVRAIDLFVPEEPRTNTKVVEFIRSRAQEQQ